ncbi:OmpA family protein [Runella aurantiaca]|uniref:OmpA-like domain-containing protein n=1 Tax=Runella aurantiaca TaxID=2282308 RepID=A0A369I0E4_9BACT|nr:OmpA family protein [Runella aurantiaca]RDB03078.1 hypothetical protein DVG78_25275 [Runella aurantiaca]
MARFVTDSQIHGYSIAFRPYFRSRALPLLHSFLLFLVVFISTAQKRVQKHAQKEFEAANRTLQFNPEQALKEFRQILILDSTFAPAYMRIGQLLERDLTQKGTAINFYEKAVELDSTEIAFKNLYEILGKHYLARGVYSKAVRFFQGYLKFPGTYLPHQQNIQRYLSQCLYAQKVLAVNADSTSRFSLPSPINGNDFQSYPVLTADLKTLIFTRFRGDEDLFVSQKEETGWSVPRSLSPIINTDKNEGTCSVSADGNTLVFTACHRPDGLGSCDLYISKRISQTWQLPQNLGPIINSQNWESQPGLSADGRTLYFSSDRPLGVGGKDIWVAQLDTSGVWTSPQNLGKTVNTAFDEISPFIHSNNESLFFASDGREGMGGFDVYLSKLTDIHWSVPINLGYPLNDFADQQGFYIAPDCKQAFYSYKYKLADKEDGITAGSKICYLQLPDTLAALCPRTFVLKGKVLDAEIRKPLKATLTIHNQSIPSFPLSVYATNDSTGECVVIFPNRADAFVLVESSGYYPKILRVDSATITENEEMEIALVRFHSDKSEVLKNVLFVLGSAELEAVSSGELDRLVYFLEKNKSVKLIIEGHTDDLGDSKYNELLSLDRAKKVVHYLIVNGVDSKRLRAEGFGYRKPLIHNKSEEARRLNRRVSWRVIE